MIETIAIYYENTIIYWNSILLVIGIFAGFVLGLSFFAAKNSYHFPCYIYLALSTIVSVILGKIVHWYTHIEQYDSFNDAITNLTSPGYSLPGVMIALWITAFILSPILKNHSRFELLDSFAPSFAFIFAIIKFGDIFSDTCLGKVVVENPFFKRLPFSKAVIDSSGNVEYRFATFFVSFLLLLIIAVILGIFQINDAHRIYKDKVSLKGHTFRFFLVLYGGMEVIMDSTRYDASHLYFPGQALASLNKGAGFMGLSQFFGALFLIYAFIYYLISSIKANGKSKKHILPWILFITGLILGAGSEYLVQRFTGMYLTWYLVMTLGILMMIASVMLLYNTCISKSTSLNSEEDLETTDEIQDKTEKKTNNSYSDITDEDLIEIDIKPDIDEDEDEE